MLCLIREERKSQLSTRSLFVILTIIFFVGILIVGIIYTNSSREALKTQELAELKKEVKEFILSSEDPSKEIIVPDNVLRIEVLNSSETDLQKKSLYDSRDRIIFRGKNEEIIGTIKTSTEIEIGDIFEGSEGNGKITLHRENLELGEIEAEVIDVSVPEKPQVGKCTPRLGDVREKIKNHNTDKSTVNNHIISGLNLQDSDFCEVGSRVGFTSSIGSQGNECGTYSWSCEGDGGISGLCDVSVYRQPPGGSFRCGYGIDDPPSLDSYGQNSITEEIVLSGQPQHRCGNYVENSLKAKCKGTVICSDDPNDGIDRCSVDKIKGIEDSIREGKHGFCSNLCELEFVWECGIELAPGCGDFRDCSLFRALKDPATSECTERTLPPSGFCPSDIQSIVPETPIVILQLVKGLKIEEISI